MRRTKLRKVLVSWRNIPYKDKFPTFIGYGAVFVFPAQELGVTHYLVTRTVPKAGATKPVEWGCNCKSYGNKDEDKLETEGDDCKHITRLKEEWEAAQ